MCIIRFNETRSNSGRINKHMTISLLDRRWPTSSHGIMSAFSRHVPHPSSLWNPSWLYGICRCIFHLHCESQKVDIQIFDLVRRLWQSYGDGDGDGDGTIQEEE